MTHHGLRRTSDATSEPLALEVAKEYLRVDHSDEDALISALIVSAREECEKYTQLALIAQEWTITAGAVPVCGLELPRPPLISINSVEYRDADDTWQPWSEHHVDLFQEPARLYFKSWPSVGSTLPDRLKVVYTAGYGSSAEAVPSPIVTAMKLIIRSLYDREDEGGPLRDAAERILDGWRIPNAL